MQIATSCRTFVAAIAIALCVSACGVKGPLVPAPKSAPEAASNPGAPAAKDATPQEKKP
jgi:predicted small lipoprotein YifL